MRLPIIDRYPRTALLLLAAVMLLPGLFSLPLIDRDEPRFAHATVEMMYRSEWVVPYFNDQYRFDKPPLTYWWMRVHFWAFGVNEFAARLHSAISAFLSALLLFGFARRLGVDSTRAFYAAAGWLTCLQVLVHARMAVADMPLILFLILTMRALWELQNRDPDRPFAACYRDPWFYLLGISIGLGFLAKGPLAQFIPLLAILLWALFNRFKKRPSPNFGRLLAYFLVSAPLWLGLMASWGIPALLATRGEFYDVGIGRHVVERGTSAFNSRLFIPGVYYLVAMVPFLLPWSPRIPDTLKSAWRAPEQAGTFLLGWFASPFLIFSFYATQLPHYILPGYPAFFLLLFWMSDRDRSSGKWAKALGIVSIVLPVGAMLFFAVSAFLIRSDTAVADLRPLMLWGVAGSTFIALATLLAFRRKNTAVLIVAALGALLVIPISHTARDLHVTLRLREALAGRAFDSRISWKFNEPSLVWYFDDGKNFAWDRWTPDWERPAHNNILMVLEHRRWRIDGETVAAILRGEDQIPPTKARRESEDFQRAVASVQAGGGEWEEVKVAGWSPATSSWIELVALVPRKRSSAPSSE